MKIFRSLKTVSFHNCCSELEEKFKDKLDPAMVRKIAEHFCGDFQGDNKTSEFYLVCDRDYWRTKKTVFQRFLTILVGTVVLVQMPVQWLITGETGISRKTKFGRVILDICGER